MPRFKFKVGDVLLDPITKEQIIIERFFKLRTGAALKHNWFVSLTYKSEYGAYHQDRPYSYVKVHYELDPNFKIDKEVKEWLND